MPSIGAPELIIILLIVLLVFGGTKLPKLARSLGEAKNEFEKSTKPGATDATTPAAAAAPSEPSVTMTAAEYEALRARSDAAKKD